VLFVYPTKWFLDLLFCVFQPFATTGVEWTLGAEGPPSLAFPSANFQSLMMAPSPGSSASLAR
jgi:hypothetical protein